MTRTPAEAMEILATTWGLDGMTDPAKQEQQATLFADDCVVIEPPTLPHGGRFVGPAGFGQLREKIASWIVPEITQADYYPMAEDMYGLRTTITWTSTTTGKSAVVPAFEILKFRDGQIVEVEVFPSDTKAMLDTAL